VDAFAAETAAAETLPAADAVDYKDRWLRAEADLQNFRRRAQRDVEEARRAAEERVLLEIVAAIDDLERALDSARAAAAADAYVQGVQLVAQRLSEYLTRQGVTALDPLGQPFDPRFHEALLEVPAAEGARPGDVVEVALKGYRRGERVLRAARVVVARRGDGA
jgi:molecular chaperone GrpE